MLRALLGEGGGWDETVPPPGCHARRFRGPVHSIAAAPAAPTTSEAPLRQLRPKLGPPPPPLACSLTPSPCLIWPTEATRSPQLHRVRPHLRSPNP
eukprot:1190583-Prorocentrum_minimum.AAC.5